MYAYVYFVNSTITKRTMDVCNKLSEENIFIHKLIFCNNEVIVRTEDLISLSLEENQHVKIKCIGSCELKAKVTSDNKLQANKLGTDHSGCILIHNNGLLCFKMFHSQIVEELNDRLLDTAKLNTLQLINCNILSSVELSWLGKIISSTKKQWTCINFSGCNIEDKGCATLSRMCKQYTKINDVTVKVLNLTSNRLTSSSLKDISSIVLRWKVEKVLISCNEIYQYDLCHKISAMAKHEIFKQYTFQIEVGAGCKSVIIVIANSIYQKYQHLNKLCLEK